MARRKYRRRKPFKVKLKKTTIYTLFSILSIAFGGALFASYTKGNEILTELNVYLTSYFGPLSLTVPINVILFGFLLTRIRASFTKANVFFGFLLLTLALMGLFQSGQVGEKIFQISNSIFGSILTILLFAAATLVGLVVFLNLSLGQVFEGIKGMFKLLSILINKISPLFKSKKQFAVSNMKQITIKGLKEEEINKEPPRPLPKAKKGEMADTLVLNKPL